MGYVYIIKLDNPLGNERHQASFYVGWAKDPYKRCWLHEVGLGSAFTRAACKRGIKFEIVHIFEGTRADERKVKNWKNTRKWLASHGIIA